MFIEFKPLNNDGKTKSKLLNDAINHCSFWRRMMADTLSTSCHETVHGCNSELRTSKQDFLIFAFPDGNLNQPSFDYTGKKNGFYLFNNKAIILQEPNLRKRDAAPFIPSNLRGSRFDTYITGQSAWDDTPLYIFDEWNAYCAGTECALELASMNDMSNKGTDISSGPIEFAFYSIGLCMAIQEKQPNYFTQEPTFKDFVAYQLNRSIKASAECNKIFPWDSTGRLLDFYNSKEGEKWRAWAGTTPTPTPTKIDRNKFNLA